jgi:hypothetical protein
MWRSCCCRLPWMPSVLQWSLTPLISACSVSVHCLCACDLLQLCSVAAVVSCGRASALPPALHLRSAPCTRVPARSPAHSPRSQTQWRQHAGTVFCIALCGSAIALSCMSDSVCVPLLALLLHLPPSLLAAPAFVDKDAGTAAGALVRRAPLLLVFQGCKVPRDLGPPSPGLHSLLGCLTQCLMSHCTCFVKLATEPVVLHFASYVWCKLFVLAAVAPL